ncbi:MAG: alpha/beta hydrolase [Pseudomonadota bacterium]
MPWSPGPGAALPLAPGAAVGLETWWLTTPDGVTLRAGQWPAVGRERGLALLLTGRTEFLEKAAITAAGLTGRGYRVISVDWRGQGLSDRLLPRIEKAHVSRFSDYLCDLEALLGQTERRPDLVLGHSMGGAIALLARREGLLVPAPLVLSAPMVAIAIGGFAARLVRLMSAGARRLGALDRWMPVPRASRAYPLAAAFEDNMLTRDRAVWDWMVAAARADPAFALATPTLGWLSAADEAMGAMSKMGRLDGPGLVLWGEQERVIAQPALAEISKCLGIEGVCLPDALHEALIDAPAPRAAAWATIDRFLGTDGSAGVAGG